MHSHLKYPPINELVVGLFHIPLLALKAQESQRTAVQSHVQGSPTGAEAQLNTTAQQLAASRNIPFAQAYVEAMKLHPELYQQYLAEKSAPVRANTAAMLW